MQSPLSKVSAPAWLAFIVLALLFFARPAPPAATECAAATYDVSAVDWKGLKADLALLAEECQCAPILVRLSWHDSGTFSAANSGEPHKLSGGSSAAQRFPDGESQHPANAGLAVARGLVQPYKEKYPAVGYADLWALAAITAIEWAGGPSVPFRAGRADVKSSAECVANGRLPDGDKGASHLRTVFNRMGFNDSEIVALSGAHTLGACHASRSGFEGPWTDTPLRFDTRYFELLLECEWQPTKAPTTGAPQMACPKHPSQMMLSTDVALVTDPKLAVHTKRFAADEAAFFSAFVAAFSKLQENSHAGLTSVGV